VTSLGAAFPIFPVEPGVFSIFREKRRFGTEKNKVNQPLAGQFPSPAKREFIRP
jgi:hypothetical protein